jgi:hypothetical protein
MTQYIFNPGAVHTAKFSFADPSLVGLALSLELFLSLDGGKTKAATTGPQPFTCAATNPFTLSITDPAAAGAYIPYVAISYGGVVVETLVDSNTILITGGSITPIVWT